MSGRSSCDELQPARPVMATTAAMAMADRLALMTVPLHWSDDCKTPGRAKRLHDVRVFSPGTDGPKVAGVMFDVAADSYGKFMGRFSEPLARTFVKLLDIRPGR